MAAAVAALLLAAAAGTVRDVAPPHSHPIVHQLRIEFLASDVAPTEAARWAWFLGPAEPAKSGLLRPFRPLPLLDPARPHLEAVLSALNPLDFDFDAPRLYVVERARLIDGQPPPNEPVASTRLVEPERYADVSDARKRRITTYRVRSVAPLVVELLADERFDGASFPQLLLRNLLLTFAVELAVAALLLRRIDRRLVGTLLLVNVLTNPALTLVVIQGRLAVYAAEAAVVLVELPLVKGLLRLTWPRAVWLTVAMNLASFCFGLLT